MISRGSLGRWGKGGPKQMKSRLLALPRSEWSGGQRFTHYLATPHGPAQGRLCSLHRSRLCLVAERRSTPGILTTQGTHSPCWATCLPTWWWPCALAHDSSWYSWQRFQWGQETNKNKWPALLWPSFRGRAAMYIPSRAVGSRARG